jgi:hypothetical protein
VAEVESKVKHAKVFKEEPSEPSQIESPEIISKKLLPSKPPKRGGRKLQSERIERANSVTVSRQSQSQISTQSTSINNIPPSKNSIRRKLSEVREID